MTEVRAKVGFEHYGRRQRDEEFEVSPQQAKSLQSRGLVEIIGEADNAVPLHAAGEPLSASPAAQASTPPTPKPSASGETSARSKKAARKLAKNAASSKVAAEA